MILDEIIASKKEELVLLKAQTDIRLIISSLDKVSKPRDFFRIFSAGGISLIAEIKRTSPSAGVIQESMSVEKLAIQYESGGASALSVLTDKKYFGGTVKDLMNAKNVVNIPVLRKEFIIDEYQVYESRMVGADALLLIVRVLSAGMLGKLLKLTEELGMAALVEVHNEEEVRVALGAGAKIIGINNRDLGTLEVDLKTTVRLLERYPELKKKTVISESGIKSRVDVEKLLSAGVKGILVGESLLRSENIEAKIKELVGR